MNRDALRALVEIVELGSLVAASRRLGVPRPTLRRRLDELETEVGVSLLVRTRSGSVPTEAGRLLAKRGRDLLRDEAAALAEAREVAEEPRGSLELVIPVGMAAPPVAALMFSLRERYPKLVVRIRTSENPVASLEKEIDVAMMFGGREPGGRWVSVEVARIRRQLVASPTYLERAGTPQSLEDLADHDLLTWTPPQETGEHWPLVSGGGFHTHPIIASPDIHLVRQLAALGLGIALTPDAGIPEPGPPLVPVMRDTVGDHVPIRLIVAAAMERLPRIRAFLMEVRRLVREFNPEFVR